MTASGGTTPPDGYTAPLQSPGDPAPILRNDQALIDVAVASTQGTDVTDPGVIAFPTTAGGGVAVIDRDSDELHQRAGHNPARSVAGTTVVRDEKSLIEVVTRWADHDNRSVVYADPLERDVVAVLDDDWDAGGSDSGGPGPTGSLYGWRRRRVRLELVHTTEWERWAQFDRKMLTQEQFAEHVEESLEDIRDPSAADMLEIAQTLQATTGVTFRQSTRLASGQRQFTYAEETQAQAGASGTLVVPEQFELALVPWQGRDDAPFEVHARLRYRIGGTGLRIGYVLMDVERILRTAFRDDVITPIRAAGLKVVHGTP